MGWTSIERNLQKGEWRHKIIVDRTAEGYVARCVCKEWEGKTYWPNRWYALDEGEEHVQEMNKLNTGNHK